MRDRISMLLKAKQRGSEVLMPSALWFRKKRHKFWIDTLCGPARNIRGKNGGSKLLCVELLSVRTVRKS